jgi:hypothetical protein
MDNEGNITCTEILNDRQLQKIFDHMLLDVETLICVDYNSVQSVALGSILAHEDENAEDMDAQRFGVEDLKLYGLFIRKQETTLQLSEKYFSSTVFRTRQLYYLYNIFSTNILI